MIEACKWRDYESRLRLTNLASLETRADRADTLEVFKILNGLERVELGIFFQRNEERKRAHIQVSYETSTAGCCQIQFC